MRDDIQGDYQAGQLIVAQGAYDSRTRELTSALEQKLALLHEVDHRVKNNLQLITSLLRLQARRSQDPAVRRALTGAQERVNAIATVHRRLFRGEDVERFDVAAFVKDLVADVIGASGRRDIQSMLRLEPVDLPASQAAPLALLISELLVNAVHHAFPDQPGTITVTVWRESDAICIEISDDGVGMGTPAAAPGFGETIVRLLCGQLRGEYDTTDAHPGVKTVIRLPVDAKS